MTLQSGPGAAPELGNSLPLSNVPVGMQVHNIELQQGRGGQMCRSAGTAATLMSRDGGYAQLRLPSGEVRKVREECYATIGQVGNLDHENVVLGQGGPLPSPGHPPDHSRCGAQPGRPSQRRRPGQSQIRRRLAPAVVSVGPASQGRQNAQPAQILQQIYCDTARWPADEATLS